MELLIFLSSGYAVFGMFFLIGLRRENRWFVFQIDLMIFSVFGFFILTGFSGMAELTKETFGILCTMYGIIDLVYGIVSMFIKTKNEVEMEKISERK